MTDRNSTSEFGNTPRNPGTVLVTVPSTPRAVPASSPGVTSAVTGRIRELVIASLIAAMMAAISWFAAYVYPIPFTLQTLFVALAALLLSPRAAFLAMATYIGLGLIGLPVFAGGLGGPAVLLGPTGGYLIGFLLGAPIGSAVRRTIAVGSSMQLVADSAGVAAVIVVSYTFGVVWMSVVMGLTLTQAVLVGAVPFLWADGLKGVTAGILAWTVRRAVPGGTR